MLNDGESSEHAQIVALRAVCCGALTRLLLDDHNAQLIAQVSGQLGKGTYYRYVHVVKGC